MIMVYFPSDGCADDVANNRANYQFTSVIAIYFMNGAGVCSVVCCVHLCKPQLEIQTQPN